MANSILYCRCLMAVVAILFSAMTFAADIVTSVTARQIEPWNGLVEITVGLSCESNDLAWLNWTFAATNSATLAALPVSKIRQLGGDTGSGSSWSRHFIWDAVSDLGEVKIDDVALTADAFVGVQLWENGPYWATCNVGAANPEEYGYYFWWGDMVGYKRNASNNGWVSVNDGSSRSFDSSNCPTYGKSNTQLQSEGYIDSTGNLTAAHDAATAHLGAPWRMPTAAEFSALINNCTTTWTTRNGVAGRLVTGKDAYASKSIFLPAAGYGHDSGYYGHDSGHYWSSTPDSGDSNGALYAWYHYFLSSYFGRLVGNCFDGQSVRPVRGFVK